MLNWNEIEKRLNQIDDDCEELFAKKTLDEEDIKILKSKIDERLSIYLNIMESLVDIIDLGNTLDSKNKALLS